MKNKQSNNIKIKSVADLRRDKVLRLKHLIENGQYHVNSRDLALALCCTRKDLAA